MGCVHEDLAEALEGLYGRIVVALFLFTKAAYSALAADITLSAWDTDGFVRYLCLKKSVSDTLSDCVLLTWMMWVQ